MKKKNLSLRKLKQWASSLILGTIVSLSYIDKLGNQFEYVFSSPTALVRAIKGDQGDIFKSGKYTIVLDSKEIEQPEDEWSYTNLVYAHSVSVVTVQDRKTIGSHEKLLENLSGFEYIIKKPTTLDLVQFWIDLPTSKNELSDLFHVLNKYSTSYAFPDGTNSLNLLNLTEGKGFRI
ncbi:MULTISPECIES: hypothetical protein [Pseudoalteromonas]|uniref:hypothetical protein n=1 Tax=Pseudoalteromonas TaxID=53246 RepID=UPI000AA0FB10|nr:MULTISPECIES: hypothetical protein [Pseudoalteromonas]